MNAFKIKTMSKELIKDQFPGVYKEIHDEGYAHGKILGKAEGESVGREQGQRYAETMAKVQPVPLPLTAVQETAKDSKYFEMLASEYMREHKVSKGRAMMACAKLYPAAHQAYIAATNSR